MMRLQESSMHRTIQTKWNVRNATCMRLARQLYHLVEECRERFFTYVLFQSPTQSAATHLERNLLHVYYTSQLDNDEGEVDQLELDRITWQRDYMQNRAWCEIRTSILEAMQCNLVK